MAYSESNLGRIAGKLWPHIVWDSLKEMGKVLLEYWRGSTVTLAGSAVVAAGTAIAKQDFHWKPILGVFGISVAVLGNLVWLYLLGRTKAHADNLASLNKGLETRLVDVESEHQALQESSRDIRAELDHLGSIRLRVLALFNQGRSINFDFIMGGLGKQGYDREAKDQVLGLLGALAEEGKIEGDPSAIGGAYRLVKHMPSK
jgi:hypothetical protein